ncbi:MAG: hypothetical protein V2J62_12625 [candidate division KSB1 bacterium]|nr:hypothetical protein [candidate division KSB1 bacterium]
MKMNHIALPGIQHIAQRSNRPQGAPRYSDVCFSSRWRHPRSESDTLDTFETGEAFFATRLDWVYSTDPEWIAECRSRGYHFKAALNTILPDAPGLKRWEKGRIKDKDGESVTAPWMRGWDSRWGCVNSPAYRSTYLAHARKCIQGGTDAFQMDDPGINHAAIAWGGCYCAHCRDRAIVQGYDLDDAIQMHAFQKASVIDFYAGMRAAIDSMAGRHVPFSCNNYKGGWDYFAYELFDYGTAELPHKTARPDSIYHLLRKTRQLGKAQIFTYVSENISHIRRVIAMTYTCGGHCIVPWDVYLKSTPTGSIRYYGRPEDYADLYGFVRANAAYFDGYEDAAVNGTGLIEKRYSSDSPIQVEGDSIYAFVRTIPGNVNSPVVIHLVSWGKNSEKAVSITLTDELIFGDQPYTAHLRLPVEFDRALHQRVRMTKDFSELTIRRDVDVLHRDGRTIVKIEDLTLWGILVLSPADTTR